MGALVLNSGMAPSHAAEVDVLINKLVEKGLLTHQEAGQLLNEMQKEGARQETTVKETAEQVAKDTAQKTVKEEAKTWAKIPDWVNRIHFNGDFRLRYQYQNIEKSNGVDQDRNRGRYRWRFGAVGDVTEDKKWQVGFGLSSGEGDPRSTNQTFASSFEKPGVRINLAYAKYQPFEWLTAIGGQMKNPLYQVQDLMWDTDITPQGVAVPIKYSWKDDGYFFITPALFVLDEFKATGDDAYMFVLQPGVGMNINKSMWFKAAFSWYYNNDIKGNNLKWSSESNSRDAKGNYIYEYSSIGLDGEFGFLFDGPINMQHFAFFGQFVKSDADNDDSAWLAGFRFGCPVKKLLDWEIRYSYRRLEKDSVLDILPDSDFYSGKTNSQGHEVRFNFGLAKNVVFAIDYYRTEKIDYAAGKTSEPEDLVQVDINFKF
jgi:polyhydroxyalkanoate synthesis regulator phasin